MTHPGARLFLLAVVLATAWATAVAPASAEVISYYSCDNKPAFEWCDGRANSSFDGLHSWDFNKASDPNQSGLLVCEGLYKPSDGSWIGYSCAQDNAMQPYGNQTCACLEANSAHMASSGSHSLLGFAHAY